MRAFQRTSVPTFKSQSFLAVVEGSTGLHRVRIVASPYYRTYLNKNCKVGDKLTVTVTKKKPKRTIAQNNYYWHYLSEIAEETGNSSDDLHALFKKKFLHPKIKEVMGEMVEEEVSTTKLGRLEFGDYIREIEVFTNIQAPPTENYL